MLKRLEQQINFVMEIDKLVSYALGRDITLGMVEELVSVDSEYAMYALGNAVAAKNAKQTFKIMTAMLESNQAYATLLAVITKQMRRLLVCSLSNDTDVELSAKLSVKPYAVTKLRQTSSKFKQVQLKNIVDSLIDLEYKFKSGKINDESAMYLGIFNCLQ